METSNNLCIMTSTGRTENEAIKNIQEKWGLNYHVKNKRSTKIRGGFLGLMHVDGVEISYTLAAPASWQMSRYPVEENAEKSDKVQKENKILEEQKKEMEEKNEQIDELIESVNSMKKILEKKSIPSASQEHPTIKKIEDLLEANEFSASYTRKILERLKNEFSIQMLDDVELVQKTVLSWIEDSILTTNPEFNDKHQVIVLIGPTGIGKTTTVAKIAASIIFKIKDTRQDFPKIRLLTTDCFRMAAREQIEQYGEALQVSVSLVENNQDYVQILDAHKEEDEYVLVDTTGYSPNDYEHIAQLNKTLKVKNYNVHYFLCFAAQTKLSDIKNIMNQYELFNYESVIVTKFDETNNIGNVICACADKEKSISYITTGQNVPKCIEKATAAKLMSGLVGFKTTSNHHFEDYYRKEMII